jgi:hypothetical protein
MDDSLGMWVRLGWHMKVAPVSGKDLVVGCRAPAFEAKVGDSYSYYYHTDNPVHFASVFVAGKRAGSDTAYSQKLVELIAAYSGKPGAKDERKAGHPASDDIAEELRSYTVEKQVWDFDEDMLGCHMKQ